MNLDRQILQILHLIYYSLHHSKIKVEIYKNECNNQDSAMIPL